MKQFSANQFKVLGVGLLFSLSLLMLGCSSGSSNSNGGNGMESGLHFTSPASAPAIDAGQSVTVTVNQPVTWSLQGVGKPPGSLGNETSTSATYTAPPGNNVTKTLQVTVVATLVSDATQTAAIGITINPLPAIRGTLSENTSCDYDPINQIGQSNGTVGAAYPNPGNGPPSVVGGTGPFTWKVSSGLLPVGLTLGSAAVVNIPSEAYLYGTPTSAGCSQITLQLTDSTGATASSTTFYVIITPPPLKIQQPDYPDAFSSTPYPPTAFGVTGGAPPYRNWGLLPGGDQLPGGMGLAADPQNSSAAVMSGAPVPCTFVTCRTFNPSVQVEDSQTPYPAYGSVTLNLFQWPALPADACNSAGGNSSLNNVNLQGSYAFLLRGFDSQGPVVMAGSFVADGAGNISGGVADIMRTTGSQTEDTISGGSYQIITQSTFLAPFEQAGCLMLTTSSGTTAFAVSMGGCSTGPDLTSGGACKNDAQGTPGVFTTGRLIEFDDSTGTGTRASGIVRRQDSAALSSGLSGRYAFGLSGWDSSGGRYAAAGSFSANSSSLGSVAADINDGGVLQSSLSGGTGTLTLDTTTGRAGATMSVGNTSLGNLAIYVVSAREAIVADTGTPGANNPIIGGEAISSSGTLSVTTLQNSHIFHTGGLADSGPDPNVGLLHFDGAGSFAGTQYEDQAGTIGTIPLSGAYSVDSTTGRFRVWATSPLQNVGDHPLVGYIIPISNTLTRQSCVQLASCVTGFLLSTDATVQAGQMEFQTPSVAPPPPFSNLFWTGYYFFGTDEMLDASTPLLAGVSSPNPTGSVYTGIQSASYPNSSYCMQPGCVLLIPNETIAASGVYSVSSNGSASIGGGTVAVTNGNVTFYIDESPINSHPSVIVLEQ
ncbi:MAG TPA: hypothetical protein VMU61_08745 [Candidatus Aquilonibacter sp.]|nr:hypothetical protein [Candidatus Aquilonibacter sp.]